MASSEDEDRPAPAARRKHDRTAPDPLEALDLQTPDGPLPGIPLGVPNGKVPVSLPPSSGTQAGGESSVCVPCLIARGVMILVLTGALIALIVVERRKAQAAAKESR